MYNYNKIILNSMKKINYRKLIISLLIPQLAGLLGIIANFTSLNSWYLNINKPSFNPPGWIFGLVWTILFILMGIALYLVWQEKEKLNKRENNLAWGVFGAQLFFNVLWSYSFFFFRNPLAGLVNIIFLLVLIVGNIIVFYKIKKEAGWLLVPYFLWVSFASVLNYFLFILN